MIHKKFKHLNKRHVISNLVCVCGKQKEKYCIMSRLLFYNESECAEWMFLKLSIKQFLSALLLWWSSKTQMYKIHPDHVCQII